MKKLGHSLISTYIFILIVVIWEVLAATEVYNVRLLPPPSQAFRSFILMVEEGVLSQDLTSSMFRYITGLFLGSVIGVFLGVVTGKINIVARSVNPLLHYLRAIPLIALIPVAILLFGIGAVEKVFIVAWGCMFPVWLNTHIGISSVPEEYIKTALTLGISDVSQYRHVLIPAAMPYIIAGIRISIATGFFALAAAEMIGTSKGISFRILFSYEFFQTDRMIAGIITLGMLALTFDFVFSKIIKLVFPWTKELKN